MTSDRHPTIRAQIDALVQQAAATPPQWSEPKRRLLEAFRRGHGAKWFAREQQPQPTPSLALSGLQMSIWAAEQLYAGAAVNSIGVGYDIEGPIDLGRLRTAIAGLIKRHDILRAGISVHDGRPSHVVAATVPTPFETIDLSDLSEQDCTARLDETISELMGRCFTLTAPPLLHFTAVRCGERRFVLLIAAHHLIADASSLAVLVAELEELYAGGERNHRSVALAQVEPSPGLPALAAAVAERLKSAPQTLDLPSTLPRPDRRTNSCRALTHSVGDGAAAAAFARAHRLTEFEVLMTAFAIAAGRIANQEDVVIGIPVLLRDTPDLDRTIGCHVNLLPFRATFDGSEGFLATAHRLATLLRSDLRARHQPFHQTLKSAGLSRAANRHPLVQVVFTAHSAPAPQLKLGDAIGHPRALARRASPFDLWVAAQHQGGELQVAAEYLDCVFTPQDIVRILEAFRAVLSQGIRRPQLPIRMIDLIPAAERQAIADIDEARFAGEPATLVQVFDKLRLLPAEQEAIRCGEARVSYGQLRQTMRGIAAMLTAAGVSAGDRVAVLLERRAQLPAALLAVLDVCAAYIPLDPTLPTRRLAAILDDAAPKVLLHSARSLRDHPQLAWQAMIDIDAKDKGVSTLPGGIQGADADRRPAYLIYTSGSSGRPKGVEVSRGSLANLLSGMAGRLALSDGSVMLSATTVSFDIAALELFLPLAAGARIVLAGDDAARDPRALAALMRSEMPSHFQATPSLFASLLDSAGWSGSRDLTLLCGGEALPADLVPRLSACCRELYNLYGPTETTIWSTIGSIRRDEPVHVGTPIEGTRIYVLDRWNQLRPFGVRGEIAIGGRGVAIGYVGLDELTRQRFIDDPRDADRGRVFLTGDIGLRRSDGVVEVFGRSDEQVKVRGFRVEYGEIEAALATQPGVSQTAAFVLEGTNGSGARLGAAIVGPHPIDIAATRARLRTVLPAYMIPHRLIQIEKIPLTSSGKIDRKALAAIRHEAIPDDHSTIRDDHLDARLVQLVARHLDHVPGADDDFFEHGGDSIGAIQLLAEVRKQFGVTISLARFLKHGRTIAGMQSLLNNGGRTHAPEDIAALLDAVETMSEQEALRKLESKKSGHGG
jgi:amino acid adenylation domain-containing protein